MDFDSWCLLVPAGKGPEREPETGGKFDQARGRPRRPARSWTYGRAATAKLWSNGNMGGVGEGRATAAAVWLQLRR